MTRVSLGLKTAFGLLVGILLAAVAIGALSRWQHESWRRFAALPGTPLGTRMAELLSATSFQPEIVTRHSELLSAAQICQDPQAVLKEPLTGKILVFVHYDHPSVYFFYFGQDSRLRKILVCTHRFRR